jgi:hypothetical protein
LPSATAGRWQGFSSIVGLADIVLSSRSGRDLHRAHPHIEPAGAASPLGITPPWIFDRKFGGFLPQKLNSTRPLAAEIGKICQASRKILPGKRKSRVATDIGRRGTDISRVPTGISHASTGISRTTTDVGHAPTDISQKPTFDGERPIYWGFAIKWNWEARIEGHHWREPRQKLPPGQSSMMQEPR